MVLIWASIVAGYGDNTLVSKAITKMYQLSNIVIGKKKNITSKSV